MYCKLSRHLLAGTSLTAFNFLIATGAMAQEASLSNRVDRPQEERSVSEVVVTGSRLRTGFLTPTPVSINTAEQLQKRAPILSDALQLLPVFRNSTGPRTQATSSLRETGAAQLNLRGLGPQRTLVLLNGRRYITYGSTGAVDIDMIPQDIVKRVEIVTGGASAAYGSDAVSGVVNFILDDDFNGIRVTTRAGVSEYGDADMQSAALSFGTSFGGERGHAIISLDYSNQAPVGPPGGRAWAEAGWGIVPNGNQRIIARPFVWAANAPGGLITTGPLAGTQFAQGGVAVPFIFGQYRNSVNMIGGSGGQLDVPLIAGIERASIFGRTKYELSESTSIWTEGTYSQSVNKTDTIHTFAHNADAFTIFADNAYLPAQIRAQMLASGQASFRLGRQLRDFGYNHINVRTRAGRLAAGLEWKLPNDWVLSAYGMHAESTYRNLYSKLPIRRNLYAAADAVINPASGQIVCRSTLAGLDPGCIPLNLFGEGSPSSAAKAYVQGTAVANLTFKQDVASVAVTGRPIALPAGYLSIAAGAEYRREAANQSADPISTRINTGAGLRGFPVGLEGALGGFPYGNQGNINGSYDVKEAFFEFDAPLVTGTFLVDALSINGAMRIIDYSTAGTVTTWKSGVVYQPTSDLRFRGTLSRDIRAGNVADLFAAPTRLLTFVARNGTSVQASTIRSGNESLGPEIAETKTVGVIYRPSRVPRLSFSADYFDIKVNGAISQLTAQATVDQCARGAPIACAQISDGINGLEIRTISLNLAALRTSGVDAEVVYDFNVGAADLSIRGQATYIHNLETTFPSSRPVDRAGDLAVGGAPRWTGVLMLSYQRGRFNLDIQERFVGKGKIDVTFTDVSPDNNISAVLYTDLSGRYKFGRSENFELFGSINNVFSKKPPIVPTLVGGFYRATNAAVYDVIGRYVTVGLRARY